MNGVSAKMYGQREKKLADGPSIGEIVYQMVLTLSNTPLQNH